MSLLRIRSMFHIYLVDPSDLLIMRPLRVSLHIGQGILLLPRRRYNGGHEGSTIARRDMVFERRVNAHIL